MSKKKKSKARTAPAPAVTVAPTVAPRSRKRILTLISAIILLALIGGAALWIYRKPQGPAGTGTKNEETPEIILQRLSQSSFQGMEKQVVDKIRTLIQEAKDNPTSAYAWGRLAINLDVHDLKKESLVCYERAASLNPEDFRWPYYKGVVLAGLGSADAISYFQRATGIKPGYAPAWVRSGQALFDAKRNEEAAQSFERAIQIQPSSHAYVGLARVYLSQGRLDESLSTLLEAVRLNPQHAEAHGLLSEVYRRTNRPDEAQRQQWITQQLPKRTPLPDEQMGEWATEGVSSYWYDVRGRSYLENGQYEAAVKELTMAANTTKDARIYDTLGIAYQYLKRFDEAATYHQKALELQPNSASMLNNMASVHFEKGNFSQAMIYMKKAIQAEPNFAYSYHHLAQMQLRSKNRKSAIGAYRLGLQRLPQDRQIATQLAWLLSTSADPSLRDGKAALQLAESSVSKMASPDPQTFIVLAAAYAENNYFDEAVKAATSARKLLGPSPGELAKRVDSQIALYRQKKPYRE
jgi:tetratricopeptide (TPR) repeat protein